MKFEGNAPPTFASRRFCLLEIWENWLILQLKKRCDFFCFLFCDVESEA